ncbi:MAG: hypothetical protein AB8F34_03810 [Akkermansiaceae bacterium]
MESPTHIQGREACPFLPAVEEAIRPSDISDVRKRGGIDAYLAALTCAQSLWLQALPAQAMLQLNHAMSHDLEVAELSWPIPYQALVWIMTRRHEEGFLGNPVRHFQHLASRMSGANKELRTARAWVCFHLAERVLPADEFPRDERQIHQENLIIPEIEPSIDSLPSQDEREIAQRLLS